MGLLPLENYFQKMMAEYILHGLIYIICEVYIDDLLIYGRNEEIPQERWNRFRKTTRIQRNIEPRNKKQKQNKNKKVHLDLQTISFLGHEIDSDGINMSQKRGGT